jgi:hypothetical protein
MSEIERRGHPRQEASMAIMVTPNGDFHSADILDLSEGGARLGLTEGWSPAAGTRLRLFFRLDARSEVAIEGQVARVGIDHLGVQFAPAQEERIQRLLLAAGKGA